MCEKQQICSRCALDAGIPDISFDENGVCNYCHQFDRLCADSPTGEAGEKMLDAVIAQMKSAGTGRKYDVLVGISGGTDSSYLIHLAMAKGLRPLAVHLDNGWDTDISNSNMQKMIDHYQLEVVNLTSDRRELNDLFLSFMKAGLPWIDGPTDIAMVASLYNVAASRGIKYIWVGNNFRTEGKQPDAWTHLDSRLIGHVQRRFGTMKLRNFANMTPWNMIRWWFIHRIKMVRPLNYLDYNKHEIKKMLAAKYGWEDYGGHHHENIFTKFVLVNWLPRKFGIDKRKITFSACVRSGEMSRDEALAQLALPPAPPEDCRHNQEEVGAALNISDSELERLISGENHSFMDYPSYWFIYRDFRKVVMWIFRKVFCFRPMMTYSLNETEKSEK